MSTQQINLTAELRSVTGKQVRGLRADGVIPAVVYERGKDSISISVAAPDAMKVLQKAGRHHPVNLTVGKDQHLAMVKDVDYEPVKGRLRHIAFHAVNKNETVTAEIPVVLEGDAPAERINLMVLRTLDRVAVKAIPAKLPAELKVDAERLTAVGDQLTIEDIKLPAGVELDDGTDLTQPLYIVEEPQKAPEPSEETAEADTEVPDEAETKPESEA